MIPEFYSLLQTIISSATAIAVLCLRRSLSKAKEEIKCSNETAVKNANGTLTHAVNAITTPFYIKRLKYKNGKPFWVYQQVNQLYADLFGLKADDMINKTDLEAGVPKKTADLCYKKDILAWSTQDKVIFLKEVSNGGIIKFQIVPMVGADTVLGFEFGRPCKEADALLNQ